MRSLTIKFAKRCSAILLLSFLLTLSQSYALESSEVEIYVHPSVPDKQYSLADLRSIFAMRKKHWPDGTKITVFVLPDDVPLHRQFTKSKLNMFPHQFRRIWDRLIFSGTGQAPEEVESYDEMLEKIETVPGAIGYLKKQSKNTNIRIINYE